MNWAVGIPWIVVALAAVIASVTDVRCFKVHNRLTFPLLFGGLLFHTAVSGWSGTQMALAGSLLGLGIMLLPYAAGAMGAGDVKFVVAVGAWIGAVPMLTALGIGFLATGVYSAWMLFRQGRLRDAGTHFLVTITRLLLMGRALLAEDRLEPVQTTVQRANRRERLIPFSAMVSIGVFVLCLTVLNAFNTTGWGAGQ